MASNTLLTPDMITKEALSIIHEKPTFLSTIDKQLDGSFGKEGAKVGSSMRIRKPVQYKATVGTSFDMTSNVSDTIEEYATLTANRVASVTVEFGALEASLSLDDYSNRILKPAMAQLVAQMEADAMGMILKSPGEVAATATAAAFTDLVQAGAMLDLAVCPRDDMRYGIVNPLSQKGIIVDTKGLFQSAENIAAQYRDGFLGMTGGFNMAMSTRLPGWTAPASDVAGTVNDTYAAGDTSITVAAFGTTETINAGAVFTIAGVYGVDPETKASTGVLYKFVAGANVTMSGGGGDITLVTPVYATGGRQNVTALPGNGAVVTVLGAGGKIYRSNAFYHKNAYTLATAPIADVEGAVNARAAMDGISISFAKQGAVLTRNNVARFDILYGFVAQRPEWGYRILEATA